jgi:hypothetical protein
MTHIMIKCPQTCHAIRTGVEVDSDGSFHSLLDVAYHTNCPLCGYNHTWFKHDAWLADTADTFAGQVARSDRVAAGQGVS